jgi:hypothetical protein
MRSLVLVAFGFVAACSSSSNTASNAGTNPSVKTSTVTDTSTTTQTNVSASTSTFTSTSTDGSLILYGSPYTNVNMWEGPVNYTESDYHNACGLEDGSKYPSVIQNLYGNYIIGLDGNNIPNVEEHCDNCAQLTANGKTIVAHIVTYGDENGVAALDLSVEARSALGLSNSNWTGAWQFCSCPTNGTPIYYEFDSRQWADNNNFWYMRIWTRNQHLPITRLETKLGSSGWVVASQVSDGAWETQSGVDFSGGFQVRVTAVDNQQMTDTIPPPTGINPANPVAGKSNFQ